MPKEARSERIEKSYLRIVFFKTLQAINALNLEINIKRLDHLLSLYDMSRSALCTRISGDRINPIQEKEIFGGEIKLSLLKKIDKVFEKGINYYLDPSQPPQGKDVSVFFRKTQFKSDLNFGSRKVVNRFESLSNRLQALSRLSEISIERKLRFYEKSVDPAVLGMEFHDKLLGRFIKSEKAFLEHFITQLSERNIFVFEFVEVHNQSEKANIDGFFIQPNVIVLKRQKYLKREIFSLAHEFGHYLLNEEEVEEIKPEVNSMPHQNNQVETWCNEFAFHLIAGPYCKVIDGLAKASKENDYHHDYIKDISQKTHLSRLAIYTRLLFKQKISNGSYQAIKRDISARMKEAEDAERKRLREGFGRAVAINSPLTVSTFRTAYQSGLINEFDVSKALQIKPEKLEAYLP